MTAAVSAAPIVPTFGTFGTLPGATFGGTGIPNDAVAITTIIDGGNTITLGLTAHPRFENPPLTNDGAGTFFATPGANFGDPTFNTMPSSFSGATWNYGMYIDIAGGGTFADYEFDLLFDFDPAADTDESAHGVLDVNAAILTLPGPPPLASITHAEDTQNLNFGFFSIPSSFITTATPTTFDPFALGEYTLSLRAFDGMTLLGESAIQVNVVPEPTSFALFGMCAGGMAVVRRRRRTPSTRC